MHSAISSPTQPEGHCKEPVHSRSHPTNTDQLPAITMYSMEYNPHICPKPDSAPLPKIGFPYLTPTTSFFCEDRAMSPFTEKNEAIEPQSQPGARCQCTMTKSKGGWHSQRKCDARLSHAMLRTSWMWLRFMPRL